MKLVYPTRRLIRTDGSVVELDGPQTIEQIHTLIGAATLDSVMLDGMHVMCLDDLGHPKALPVNEAATALYLMRCGPGIAWQIRGDVVIVPDNDFAPDPLKGFP